MSTSDTKIDFDTLNWETPAPGARFKAYRAGSRHIRLVEFTAEFVEPDWCQKGHIGFVLDGELEIDFQGRREVFKTGDALLIGAGAQSAHKARSLTPIVRLFLVEEN